MILYAYIDVYVLWVCIVGHGYTTYKHDLIFHTLSFILIQMICNHSNSQLTIITQHLLYLNPAF